MDAWDKLNTRISVRSEIKCRHLEFIIQMNSRWESGSELFAVTIAAVDVAEVTARAAAETTPQ